MSLEVDPFLLLHMQSSKALRKAASSHSSPSTAPRGSYFSSRILTLPEAAASLLSQQSAVRQLIRPYSRLPAGLSWNCHCLGDLQLAEDIDFEDRF